MNIEERIDREANAYGAASVWIRSHKDQLAELGIPDQSTALFGNLALESDGIPKLVLYTYGDEAAIARQIMNAFGGQWETEITDLHMYVHQVFRNIRRDDVIIDIPPIRISLFLSIDVKERIEECLAQT